MLHTIWETILHTPWWVFVLLFFLLKIGFEASKPRTVSFYRLLIIPILFTGMTIQTLTSTSEANFFNSIILTIAIFIGIVAGWWQFHKLKLEVDTQKWLIKMPGTWSTLIIILIIFTSKYYFGYELAVNPQIISQTSFIISLLSVSGVCTGLFIGRVLFCFYQIQFKFR